jgi:hypothetical protein
MWTTIKTGATKDDLKAIADHVGMTLSDDGDRAHMVSSTTSNESTAYNLTLDAGGNIMGEIFDSVAHVEQPGFREWDAKAINAFFGTTE